MEKERQSSLSGHWGKDDAEARKAGRWIISSSLVKTVVFADPNLGGSRLRLVTWQYL